MSSSLKEQERIIRGIFERNNPEEIKKLEEAEKDPNLDPEIKLLIEKVRHDFADFTSEVGLSGIQSIDFYDDLCKAANRSKRIPRKKNLSETDEDFDSFDRDLRRKDQ